MAFTTNWTAEVLAQPPLIAPARQYTYPRQVAGEEDALARGALLLQVNPKTGGTFLATCALGFTSPNLPTGILPCPNPNELCAVAGGYAYLINTLAPARSTHISLKPVVEVRSLQPQHLLLFVGFHQLIAWGEHGAAWKSAKLTSEGIRIAEIADNHLLGYGWDLRTDREIPFRLDLRTGLHDGGVQQAG